MRIAVTGLGVVSALGVGVDRNFAALAAEQSGISPEPRILRSAHRLPVGELKFTNEELHRMCGVELKEHLSRTALLGILAVREAIVDARLASDARVGLVSATSVGGMDLTEHFFEEFMADEGRGRLRDVRMHDCAASTEAIAAHCHIRGYRTTISTACSSSANAILQGMKLLRHGILDAVVVGGTDALSAFTLNGFKSLMILDEAPCRPFDATRRGLNLGEGAGYLVLQREGEHARDTYCYVSGAANSNDAHHQTASSEEGNGALLAMQGALQMAGVDPSAVDYVNVHGTGTGITTSRRGVPSCACLAIGCLRLARRRALRVTRWPQQAVSRRSIRPWRLHAVCATPTCVSKRPSPSMASCPKNTTKRRVRSAPC